jgi:uncharacterized protein
MNISANTRNLALACALFVLAGCGGAGDQFYRLTAEAPARSGRSGGASIGIGPVSLPGYLDRAELVFQTGDNQFQVPANVRWAGSLQENISRVLAADVGAILGSANVVSYPWRPGAAPSRRIAIDIRQFHSVSGSGAILEASWRSETGAGGASGTRHSISLQEPIQGDGYTAVVAAESRLLLRFAEAIAR